MKTALKFDFIVNKENKTITIRREFNAALHLVWSAFTKQELLDEWWAPQPWVSKTKYMNFKEGGRRFYAMIGPQGEEHWSVQDFTTIAPTRSFKFFDAFTDKDENINNAFPGSEWSVTFSEANGITTSDIVIQSKTLADLEMHLQMGFKEGFTMTLNYLDQLLQKDNKAV
jgi:uncharacterized protein YndB with AHSA1/START domain